MDDRCEERRDWLEKQVRCIQTRSGIWLGKLKEVCRNEESEEKHKCIQTSLAFSRKHSTTKYTQG